MSLFCLKLCNDFSKIREFSLRPPRPRDLTLMACALLKHSSPAEQASLLCPQNPGLLLSPLPRTLSQSFMSLPSLSSNLYWHITLSTKPSSIIKFKIVPLLKYSHSSSLFYFSLYHLSLFNILSNSFPYFISFPSSFQTERKAVSPASITESNTVNVQ